MPSKDCLNKKHLQLSHNFLPTFEPPPFHNTIITIARYNLCHFMIHLRPFHDTITTIPRYDYDHSTIRLLPFYNTNTSFLQYKYCHPTTRIPRYENNHFTTVIITLPSRVVSILKSTHFIPVTFQFSFKYL